MTSNKNRHRLTSDVIRPENETVHSIYKIRETLPHHLRG